MKNGKSLLLIVEVIMPRNQAHVIETRSKDYIRNKIDSYYSNGDALVREWNERDYGIDFVVEFFCDGTPTGNIAYLQLKATEEKIKKNEKSNDVSCSNVSLSSLDYAKQRKIPFVLIYISMSEPVEFYFVDIQSLDVVALIERAKSNATKRTTIKIPISNKSTGDMAIMFDLIKSYF